MPEDISGKQMCCLPEGWLRRSLPKEARNRRTNLFTGGRAPTEDEKWVAFSEIKGMDGGEWYSEEQRKKWCSGREVQNKKNNQDFATNHIRSQISESPHADSILRVVSLIQQCSDALGISDETVYRIMRDMCTAAQPTGNQY